MDGVELYRMTPDTMETAGLFGYDLYVFDGALPDVMPDDGGIFIIDPPEGNGYIPTEESRSLNCYSEGASELGGGDSLSFIISEAKTVERPSWAVTECSADGVPLIMRGENGAQKVCVFAFDIHDSDLPLLKEFPIMIYNLSDWFMPGRLGNGSEAKCGQSLEINAPADAAEIEVTDPDGNGRVIAPPFPASEYSDTPEPGFYTVYIENSDGETSETAIAVNALTDGESDLEALYGQDVEGSAGRASKGGASLTGILTILAAAALLAEWWVKYYAIDADKIYLLIFIPIIIIAAVFITKKFIKGDRYINTSTALRTVTVISLILSLSGMSVTDRAKNDTTLFLADISESVSAQKERVAEFINSAQSHKETGDKTAVSLFGGRAVTAVSPTRNS